VSRRVSRDVAHPWRLYYTRYYTGAAISTQLVGWRAPDRRQEGGAVRAAVAANAYNMVAASRGSVMSGTILFAPLPGRSSPARYGTCPPPPGRRRRVNGLVISDLIRA
jgi:hypothetical protein